MAKIIIVDDSQTVREQLRDVLKSAGHTVVEASDGNDGFTKILETPADLVISDYNMPGYDGVTMLQKVKEKQAAWKTPVLMLTTETSEKLKVSGKQVGVVAWIVKPFVKEKLLQAIEKLTAKK